MELREHGSCLEKCVEYVGKMVDARLDLVEEAVVRDVPLGMEAVLRICVWC